jgi:hypothetical protein
MSNSPKSSTSSHVNNRLSISHKSSSHLKVSASPYKILSSNTNSNANLSSSHHNNNNRLSNSKVSNQSIKTHNSHYNDNNKNIGKININSQIVYGSNNVNEYGYNMNNPDHKNNYDNRSKKSSRLTTSAYKKAIQYFPLQVNNNDSEQYNDNKNYLNINTDYSTSLSNFNTLNNRTATFIPPSSN